MASTIKVDNVQNQPGTNIINKCSVTTTIGAGAGETIKACAATVTLGRCGGTVALAAGASQTGFGRTGTVDWITTPKVTGDSPITGVTGKGYFLNTTAGTITVNLPVGVAGSIVSMADYAGTWQTNNVTVSPNGAEKIGGINSNVTLSTEGQSVTLVYVDSTQGWVNTMDSTSNVRGNPYMVASVSGACNTLTTCGTCSVAKFVGPGTFCVSAVHACAANNLVSYMVVAGGGGGGDSGAGGGGAGGYREVVSPISPYTGSPIQGYPTPGNRITVTASPYPIVVGGGGAGGIGSVGTGGATSTFSTIDSAGGGGGGSRSGGAPPSPSVRDGLPGGSGGGGGGTCGANPNPSGGVGNTPPVTPSQGNTGGSGVSSGNHQGGGGGGIIGAGSNGSLSPDTGGPGGDGTPTEITFAAVSYGGGGGGGNQGPTAGTGGTGGGGNGGLPAGGQQAGTINTGGGGGGDAFSPGAGGAGGSGIVIIRYRSS